MTDLDSKYNLRPFLEAPESKLPVETIGLAAIDLGKFQYGQAGLEARRELASKLEKSLTTYGFFKLINHGIPVEEITKLRAITQSVFELPDQVKAEYQAGNQVLPEDHDRSLGVVRGVGFKPRGFWVYQKDVRDNVELFNFRHFLHKDIFFNRYQYHEFVKAHLEEVYAYYNKLHHEVLRKVLNLMDIILEVPEGTLWEKHFKVIENDIVNSGGGGARLLMYHELDKEYIEQTNGTWMRGHTDSTALTFILSQSVLALQIRDYATGEWKYLSHTPDSIIVNAGDSLKFLTGGYFKSAIHRVVLPPEDQLGYKRSTIIYFSDPSLTTVLHQDTLKSPKLNREVTTADDKPKITFKQWSDEKIGYFNKEDTSNESKQGVKLLGRETLMSYIDDPKRSAIKAT